LRRGPVISRPSRAMLFLLVLIAAIFVQLSPTRSVSTPRNYSDASSARFQGIILNEDPLVLGKLSQFVGSFDQSRFADNLVAVYNYVKGLPYRYDRDLHGVDEFWQTGPETIQLGGGDCEDHAILLATLIEALCKKTYGSIPQNLVWVLAGSVRVGSGSGGHAWALINLNALSSDASSRIRNIPRFRTKVEAIIGDIIHYRGEAIKEIRVELDLAKLAAKEKPLALSVFWIGDEYVELESTWGSAISEYYDKAYPYTDVWVAFNSIQHVDSPQFVPSGRPLIGSTAMIRNVAFNLEARVNEPTMLLVTIQNFGQGILGADFVLILRSGDQEVARESAYVLKYIWVTHTFFFNLAFTSPGTKYLKLELYWNNQGSLQLQDRTEFRIMVASGLAPTTSASLTTFSSPTTQPTTYRFFSLPKDYQRQQPSTNMGKDLKKIIRIEGVGSYQTPFSLKLTPGVSYIFTCSGAIGWDYYGIGPKEGETAQYTLDEWSTEIAAFFDIPLTYQFFSLPEDCRGQPPSSNSNRDLGKTVTIAGIGSYRTPFSVQLTPGTSYTFACSGAESWDYFGTVRGRWQTGETVQYVLDPKFREIAVFFATQRTITTPTMQVPSGTLTITWETQMISDTTSDRYVMQILIQGTKTQTLWTLSTLGVPSPVSPPSATSIFQWIMLTIAATVLLGYFVYKKTHVEKRPASTNEMPRASSQSGAMFCRHCGAKIPHDSSFCEVCGKKL